MNSKTKRKIRNRRNNVNSIIFIVILLVGAIYFIKHPIIRIIIALIIVSKALILLISFLSQVKKHKRINSKNDKKIKTSKDLYSLKEPYYDDNKNTSIKMQNNKNIDFIIDKDQNSVNNTNEIGIKNNSSTNEDDKELRKRVVNWTNNVNYSDSVFKKIIENSKKNEANNIDEKNTAIENNEKELILSDEVQDENQVELPPIDFSHEVQDENQVELPPIDFSHEVQDENQVELPPIDFSHEVQVENQVELPPIDFSHEVQDENQVELPPIDFSHEVQDENQVELPPIDFSHEVQDESQVELPVKSFDENKFEVPPIDFLDKYQNNDILSSNSENGAKKLIDTLESFGVKAKIINISVGPSVTRYEVQPDYGVKVSKIVSLTDDIALNLAATGVRIEAPIPGKAAVGIEIPNSKVTPVLLREVLDSNEFQKHPSKLAFAVGKDITGNCVIADIAMMPHLLIAGATGSGKSVCINTLITSLLYKASPDEVKLLMVDPKVVELGIYNGIPHLLIPVVTDPKKAAGALNWAVQEMISRYKLFADNNVRDLKGYNRIMVNSGENPLPQIVIIIDELADLMMVAPNDVEDCICRLAQMARAAGMHLVIATQRPSVNVITGVIKANIPSRISFAVSSQVDSRTILDMGGAEKLLGKGDMLFSPLGKPKPIRVQGALITDSEVEEIVSFIKSETPMYDEKIIDKIDSQLELSKSNTEDQDELLPQVINMVIDSGQASTSLIQRKFKIGYSRAARILDTLEAEGIVGPFEGSKPRRVLITRQDCQEYDDKI
ncbi:UNVERIFIED_CONTAM: DNA translocase FtsK [Acetivibrio alkalicellulosi]